MNYNPQDIEDLAQLSDLEQWRAAHPNAKRDQQAFVALVLLILGGAAGLAGFMWFFLQVTR